MSTYLVLFQFRLGCELVIGDIVYFVQFEQVAGFLVDNEVEDVDVLLVDGEDAAEEFVGEGVQHQTVETVGDGRQGCVELVLFYRVVGTCLYHFWYCYY